MTNENYPVFQTAKLLRVLIPSREGKKGEYAVGLCEHDGHEHTILFCSETFPLDILNKIIGKIIRVDPTSGRGLRAVDFKHQDFDVIKENLETTSQEVRHLKDKVDGFENRSIEWRHGYEKRTNTRFDYLEERIEKAIRVIVCAFANDEND